MMEEIEASSGELEPGTPEYEEMMQRKARIQEKLEHQRRKLDIVKSQGKMVNVQHTLVGAAIKRYQKEEALHQKLESQMESTASIDEDKIRTVSAPTKKKVSRMVMARRNR